MRWGRSFLVPVVCAAVLAVSLGATAQYPPRTPEPTQTQTPRHECARTGRMIKGEFREDSTFTPGAEIAVRGKPKCAMQRVIVRIHIEIAGDLKRLGTTKSDKDGAYLFKNGTVPKSTPPGSHEIVVHAHRSRWTWPIEVKERTKRRNTMSSTAAPLLAAWVALGGIIAAYVVTSRRRRLVTEPWGTQVDIPILDTSGFEPAQPTTRNKAPVANRSGASRRPRKSPPAKRGGSSGSASGSKRSPAKRRAPAAKRKPKTES